MKKQITLTLLAVFSLVLFNCANDDDTQQQEEEPQAETVTDADGNVYETVQVGDQIWMKENLKTTSYNDGTPITLYTFADFGNNWGSMNDQIGHYQMAEKSVSIEDELPADHYGAMYNHWAIESGKLVPEGWRIPTVEDFETLEAYVANNSNIGNEVMALKNETGWATEVNNGTNVFGFSALPNGYVSTIGGAITTGKISTWATSTLLTFGTITPFQRRMMVSIFDEALSYDENSLSLGAGVRCIKIQ